MPIDLFLKKLIIALAFIAVLTPLFFLLPASVYFPYIITKIIWFRILIGLMILLYLPLAWLYPQYRPRLNWLMISILVFGLMVTLSGIFGIDWFRSFWSNNERMEGILGIWHYIFFFIIIYSVIKEKDVWFKLLKTSILASLINGTFGLLSLINVLPAKYGDIGGRLAGLTGNPSFLAVYLLFNVFLALYFFFLYFKEKRSKAGWWLLAFAYGSLMIFLTACRGVIIGWFFGLFLIWLWALISQKKAKTRIILISLLISFLGAGVLFVFLGNNYTIARLKSLGLKDPTVQTRLFAAKISFKAWLDKPLFGWGQENFDAVYPLYYDPEVNKYANEFMFDRPHNKLLELLATNGLFGFLSYFWLWLSIIFVLISVKKKISALPFAALIAGLGGYFIQNIFLFDVHDSYLTFFLILGFLNYLTITEPEKKEIKKQKEIQSESKARPPFYIFYSVFIFIALIAIYQLNIKPYRASQKLVSAVIDFNLGQYEEAYQAANQLFQEKTLVNEEAISALGGSLLNQQAKIPPDLKTKFFELLNKEADEILKRDPYRLKMYFSKIQINFAFNNDLNHLQEAEKTGEKMFALFKNFNYSRSYYLKTLLANQKYKEVLMIADESIKMTPKIAEFYYFKAKALYQLNQKEEAIETLSEMLEPEVYLDATVLRATLVYFEEVKAYDKVLKVYQKLLMINPNDQEILKKEEEIKKLLK